MRILLVLACLLCLPISAAAMDMSSFRRLPIAHEGRVKPLDSFARAIVSRYHGSADVDGKEPVAWLADLLFSPENAIGRPFFHVSTAAAETLGLSEVDGDYYAPRDLVNRMAGRQERLRRIADIPLARRTAAEAELMTLVEGVQLVTQLSQTFSYLTPISQVPERFRTPGKQNFQRLVPRLAEVRTALKAIVAIKGEALDHYEPAEQELAEFAFRLSRYELEGKANTAFAVIPAQEGQWQSPWQQLLSKPDDLALQRWDALANAARAGSADRWEGAIRRLESVSAEPWRMDLEIWQNRLPLVVMTIGLYLISLIALRRPVVASSAFAAGLAVHAALLLMRIVILQRPPVGTLYESILFVSFIAALAGSAFGGRRSEGRIIGALAAAGLLVVSGVYAPEGDDRLVLMAVLNTQFWLATHVVCITIGYGCAVIAGLIGHWHLWEPSQSRARQLRLCTVAALLFTAVGTMLGGVWADQSWGRFWGWDPKENGALLIVLWIIWAQHARLSRQFGERGFTIVLGFLPVIVALSWFGVNLLGVGLHSYGFTERAAAGLAVFCMVESGIILWLGLRWKRHHAR